MITRKIERNYEYKHPLATIITDAEIGISSKGRRSLAASEIERLSRLAALKFLSDNYRRSIDDDDFYLPAKKVRAIMAILKVNQTEFGKLIGCQKSKVSKILSSDQKISKSGSQLAIERLAMELVMPGSTRRLLGETSTKPSMDKNVRDALDNLRYGT